ncbi:ABC transporter ATP-binding protein [Ideonella livida]|uniref:ABC transporter ATP-binding protein n=1 Tax=Ideonella livida TaxID=2707176 RepID=A0A7C9TM79_9BURK|nr:ABC transporter ATP-binding protein [Ideonella livida]NDY93718.1 ABC transporter ATP-binding protein [Ideonella livida]
MMAWFERLVDPFPPTPAQAPPARFWPFMWASTRGLRLYIAAMTGFTAIIGVFEAWLFALLGDLVDWLAAIPPAQLWAQEGNRLLALAGVLLASTLAVALQTLFKHQSLAGNFPMRLRWNFHRLMLGQSMAFYQDEFAGRVATKVMQTALAVRDVWMTLCDILVFIIIYFVTLLAVVGGFDLWLVLPLAGWLGLYLLAMRFFVPRLARVAQNQADARSLMTGRITDAYTNISTVKLFAHDAREAAHARGAMSEFLGTVHAQMRLVSWFEVCIHLLSVGLILGIAGVALWRWSAGAVGVGAVAAATAMAMRLNGISHWIMWEMAALFEHVGTVQDGMLTLARERKVLDAPQARPLQVGAGEVRFERVDFSYGQAGRQVVDGLDLVIRPGEKIGLVGRSGAGKSTVLNLLLRFYDVGAGRILIDGQDIAQVTQDSLRAQVGMVTQDTSLLHRSVRDNILYGRPDAGDEAMQAAAARAEADGFIATLTDPKGRTGYDAHVGERGVKLSGGQRQRIAIARVMLKDAPILLLDEATSALDSEVEAAIQDSLYKLMEGKTVVAIAHRLSTIMAMDRLVVMDAGRVVEQGTHAELLAAGGIYARLWAHQSGGFLGEGDTP